MRIRVDRTLCDGFGMCATHAPKYFSLDDWGYASLIGSGVVDEGDQDAAKRALLDCPVHAIIAVGEHQPSGESRSATESEHAAEPDIATENNEAISEFVR